MDILWLDAIGDEDRARVGGKAAALARLRRAGLPVPDGFVLTARAALDATGRAALLEAYRRLGGPVAVRSSATAEDLPEASYAGQYATVLDVAGEEALLQAAARCLASAPDAAAYARAVGTAEAECMAVLVQRFVEPLAAGVVFTRHPAEAGRLLVEAHAGRGDAVVSGAVTPDRYVLDRATGARRDGPEAGGLDPGALARIASLAREAETLFGAPQDVEWALGPDGPVLLQSRPITVEAEEGPDPRVRRLTRANVGEVLPGPVTPLTWTTICAFLERGFHAVAQRAGLLPEGFEGSFLVLHRRRIYLNLTLCLEAARRLPGVSPQAAERLVLGQGGAGGERGGSRLAVLPRVLGIGRRLLRMAARLPDDVQRAEAELRRLPALRGPGDADAETLARRLRGFEETGRRAAETHIACSGASGFRLALLEAAAASWLPGDPADRVNRLLAGQGGVASAAPALALESLAAEARGHAEWRAWLQGEPAALAAAFTRGAGPAGLVERLRGILSEHGHRALSEGELSAPSWDDDPTLLFAALGPLLAASRTPGFGRRAQAELRQADEEAVFCRLGPLRGIVFRWLLRSAREWVRERERTKSLAISAVQHGRRLALRAGELLLARGALRQADDVFFLTLPELLEALAGGPVPAGLARRRRRHEREGALPVPREIDLDRVDEGPGFLDTGLRGTGVSAGTGIGPARVLRPGDALAIEPGEVLIAPVLDAAYGPLLASAAGAVAEMGGMLSHGSVVARELGVPCVVDVREATRRIRSGQRVTVDGGSGRIAVAGEDPHALESEAPRALAPADPAEERLHALDAHPLSRESVYFNAFDPRSGIALVASVGVRRGGRGEAVAALALPDGRVLFALNLGPPRVEPGGLDVGGIGFGWNPVALRVRGPLADPPGFPPGPLPLLLHPRTAQVEVELRFEPRTPAIDLAQSLPPRERAWLAPLARRHVEQSGRYHGRVSLDGRAWEFEGSGSRDHSWGVRDWEAADHWRLLTVHFGHDLAFHALSVSCRGRRVEGGFVWREGRAEALARVAFVPERRAGRVRSFEAELQTVEGERLRLAGQVLRTIRVPVQPEWRPWRLLRGRPYRLLLHENYTRYECEGRVGYGMAEVTERP